MGTILEKKRPHADPDEFRTVIAALKKILRSRGITYAELAKKLNLSESGTKKIFSGRDCSFRRLSQISKVLGFRVSDLLDEVENAQMTRVRFSEVQQQYFLKNRSTFGFFVKLVVERRSVDQIKSEFRLSDSQTFKLLKKLDELGLIQLLPKNAIKLPPLSLVKDFGPGPLLSQVYQDWSRGLASDLADPKNQASGQFIIRCFQMKDETYRELLGRLLELEKEFLMRSVREMSVATSVLKPVRFAWMTDQNSFIQGTLEGSVTSPVL